MPMRKCASPLFGAVHLYQHRVLASGFSGLRTIGRVHVRADDRAVRRRSTESPSRKRRSAAFDIAHNTSHRCSSTAATGGQCHEIRPKRSFHCRSRPPCERLGQWRVEVLMAVQLSVLGLYLPPVFKRQRSQNATPDDHFTAGPDCRVIARAVGALVVLVAVQLSVLGLYLPPVFKSAAASSPPQTIISLPVQTAV